MYPHVRIASLDNVKGIVEVHCSDVEKWWKFVNDKKIEASYDELTVEERYVHGGPWMSVETCSIHINNLLVNDQYPLVAELDGKIVGELELYIGEEKGGLGKYGFIDILEVHRDYRRKGIGRALVNEAFEISKRQGCETLAVWPAKEAVGFYKKCGLDKVAYNIVYLEIDLKKQSLKTLDFSKLCSFPKEYDKKLFLISPIIFPSFVAWLKSKWRYSFKDEKIIRDKGYISNLNTAYIIESIWYNKYTANVFLWTKDTETISDAIDTVLGIAKYRDFSRARLYVEENIYKKYLKSYPHRVISNEILLIKNI
ncbi:MAG: GNAT family N-acetyltransferase [Thermoprotei archaeon]|nr:MAG: GNAT family N-acetyltransferase [Thermoprotei archaeon]